MVSYRCNISAYAEERVKNMKKTKKINAKAAEMLLPKAYRPLSSWNYFWRSVLYLIPVIGLIFLFVHAINAKSRHGRSFARSYFCGLLILAIAALIAFGVAFALGAI